MTGPDRFDSLVAALTELGEGVAVVDLKTERYLSVNDALAAMYGYAREELLELPALKGASSDRYETRVTRKDGEVIEVEVSVKPLSVRGDRQVLTLVRDVTDKRRREREIAAAELKYRTLVERLPVVTYV